MGRGGRQHVRPRKSNRVNSLRKLYQTPQMHTLSSIVAIRNASKLSEQMLPLKARRVRVPELPSKMEVSFGKQQCAVSLIGQFRGVAAYASPEQHRGKTPQPASSRSPVALAASSYSLPMPRTEWPSRQRLRSSLNQGKQHRLSPAGPNPSLKRSANGRPPGPGLGCAVHFPSPGPGVLPLSPA